MKFKHFIDEALKPSQFREYVKIWKKYGVKKLTDHVFGNKDRIYEPYEKRPDTNLFGFASNVKGEIEAMLRSLRGCDYIIKDYENGMLYNPKTKKTMRLVKFLDKQINSPDNGPEVTTYLEKLKKNFINDPIRQTVKQQNMLICYSRHPYDVAGMSTDRGWTSCMRLPSNDMPGGTNWHKMPDEIKYGTIVAYLIKEDDKNLQNPMGRIAIKPYYNDNGDIMWYPCSKGYGTNPKAFHNQVIKWTQEKLNNKSLQMGFYTTPTGIEISYTQNYIMGKKTILVGTFEELLKYFGAFYFAQKKYLEDRVVLANGKYAFDIDDIIEDFNKLTFREIYELLLKFIFKVAEPIKALHHLIDFLGSRTISRQLKITKIFLNACEFVNNGKDKTSFIVSYASKPEVDRFIVKNFVEDYWEKIKRRFENEI
jgi:hypothetical protein